MATLTPDEILEALREVRREYSVIWGEGAPEVAALDTAIFALESSRNETKPAKIPDEIPQLILDWLRIANHPNWDGYGAPPTSKSAIETARCLAGVPLPNGGLQIELHAHGWDVEIEISPDGHIDSCLFGRAL